MGKYWLPHLDRWLADAGLDVEVYDNEWLIRSRSSGGYDKPIAIGAHHTAARQTHPDPHRDMWDAGRRAWETAIYRPVGAFRLGRHGAWLVGAAGATNTQGRGNPMLTSNGLIPTNSGNRYVIAIEAMNNGIGEPWADVMLDSYEIGVAAIIKGLRDDGAYNAKTRQFEQIILDPNRLEDVHAHFEYAPTRKIDPANGRTDGRYANPDDRYGRWPMDLFRTNCSTRLVELDTPEEEDMYDETIRYQADERVVTFGDDPGEPYLVRLQRHPDGEYPRAANLQVHVVNASHDGRIEVNAKGVAPDPAMNQGAFEAGRRVTLAVPGCAVSEDGYIRVRLMPDIEGATATVYIDVVGVYTR